MNQNSEVLQIPIEDLVPNRFQPRISFDEKALNDLANSIKQHGIIQPLVVRRLKDKYEIIAGERRYKAAQIAGLISVPALLTDASDESSAEIALVENVQRKDLSSIEEAKSYRNILDKSEMTQEDLAKKMGLSQSSVANKLRLLNLNEDVQQALMEGKISERHARSLLTIEDGNLQSQLLKRVIDERLTVKQLDEEIKNIKKPIRDDVVDDVPLVNIDENLEKMKQEATDIIPSSPNSNISSQSNSENEGGKFFNFGLNETDQKLDNSPSEVPQQTTNENSFFEFGTPETVEVPSEVGAESSISVTPNDELLNVNPNINNDIETLDVEPAITIFEADTEEKTNLDEEIDLPDIINEIRDLVTKLNINNNIKVSEIDTESTYKFEIEIEKDS